MKNHKPFWIVRTQRISISTLIRSGGGGSLAEPHDLISHGQLLSTLDQLDTAQTSDLRNHRPLWIDRSDLVLCDAKVHKDRLRTDPASALSARHPRFATGNGLPVLSQLCGNGGPIECAEHPDLHELPYTGAKR